MRIKMTTEIITFIKIYKELQSFEQAKRPFLINRYSLVKQKNHGLSTRYQPYYSSLTIQDGDLKLRHSLKTNTKWKLWP